MLYILYVSYVQYVYYAYYAYYAYAILNFTASITAPKRLEVASWKRTLGDAETVNWGGVGSFDQFLCLIHFHIPFGPSTFYYPPLSRLWLVDESRLAPVDL